MSDADDKKDIKESEFINLKVSGKEKGFVQFKIKKQTPLSKLMKAYCDRGGLDMALVRFLHNGQRVRLLDTPEKLEMEEGDILDVFQEQDGGGL